ncbi:MAG: glycosyltransferase [Chloroflexi bacterium]|nr:glycosyltransferase [Chloroflexota bacterium]MDA1173155.1 glycosyltransferase [Chloroflexota bacterium]
MTAEPKRVLVFQSDLGGGGAERSALNLVNGLDRTRFAPVLVLNKAVGPHVTSVRDDVPVVEIGAQRMRGALFGLAREIRRQSPEILFSTMQGPSVMLWLARALARSKAPLVLRESNNWTARGVSPRSIGQRVVGFAYRSADRVVCLSEGVNQDTLRRYGNVATQTIYNPVDVLGIARQASDRMGTVPGWKPKADRDTIQLLAVGRLTRQKGFDLLIDAAANITDLPWHLTILGEGSDRGKLLEQIRFRGLQDRISLPGFVPNPYPWFAEADLLVLSSRWEGFGHVIVEAMATGTPVLSTRCPSGPDEIIQDGATGVLCDPDSADALATALRALISDEPLRQQLASAAQETPARFDVPTIVGQYEALFDQLLEAH